MYSPQKIYCNACGAEMNKAFPYVYGQHFKVCSQKCMREIRWRETLSIMGEPYKPDPNPDTSEDLPSKK